MTNTSKNQLRYDEGCLGAHALNLIGDRWALLVVRELMFTPKRFQMIRAGLPGVTASVLTQRLQQLAQAGVVTHDANLGIYALTPQGSQLLPVLQSLCRWALLMPGHDPSRFISPTALMISLTATVDHRRLAGIGSAGAILSGRDTFRIAPDPKGHLTVAATVNPVGDFTLEGTGNALAVAFYGPLPLAQLVEAGSFALHGDIAAAQDFVDCFSLTPRDQAFSSSDSPPETVQAPAFSSRSSTSTVPSVTSIA